MSEKITVLNLDEVVKTNQEIKQEIVNYIVLIQTKFNKAQINSSPQLAFQLLKSMGLIQMPIENTFLSGAIYVRDGKLIPFINTALPRANQYFTAWHELYHLLFDKVSFDHIIENDNTIEERKAEYFASKMLLGNLMSYYAELPKNMDFQSKVFNCMAVFQAPYKAVLIALYEEAMLTANSEIMKSVKDNFELRFDDIEERFALLGLDTTLILPSQVVNLNGLQEKINENVQKTPELKYHGDNAVYLKKIMEEIELVKNDANK